MLAGYEVDLSRWFPAIGLLGQSQTKGQVCFTAERKVDLEPASAKCQQAGFRCVGDDPCITASPRLV
ncbi:hypothetical protein NITHO_5920004 [Nitrolancea hollandica Lb]|uniref:Uncharacterized protein n=1 Tax=Nitrolancea hollandica Lb TaxID=1129897 RepID=I4EMD0_9BACT|nr:hypothetical protein NITHO_5920004 [Nitrolancea hollandica Lb]